jgi:hypothetical protein
MLACFGHMHQTISAAAACAMPHTSTAAAAAGDNLQDL